MMVLDQLGQILIISEEDEIYTEISIGFLALTKSCKQFAALLARELVLIEKLVKLMYSPDLQIR